MKPADRNLIAQEMTEKLKADEDVLAVALCGPETPRGADGVQSLELLVVVSRIPFDLDMFGRKKTTHQGSTATLSFARPERLRTAIDDEAGCWFTSGKILYGKSLHDPGGVLVDLKRAVNSVPKEKRMAAFRLLFREAREFPAILTRAGSERKRHDEVTLLGDNPAFVRTLFLVNGKPPRSEETLLDDVMELERLPQGIEVISGLMNEFDRYAPMTMKFKRAEREYSRIMMGIERLAGSM